MTPFSRPLLILTFALLLGAGPADADQTVLRAVRSAAEAQDSAQWAVTQSATTRSENGPDFSLTERFDPSQEPPWRLLQINGAAPDPAAIVRYAEQMDRRPPPPSYNQVALYLGENARETARSDDSITYQVDRLDDGALSAAGVDLSEYMKAVITVSTDADIPWVSRVVMTSRSAFENGEGTIDTARAEITYRRHQDGQLTLDAYNLAIAGSNAFQDFDFTVERQFTDWDFEPAS